MPQVPDTITAEVKKYLLDGSPSATFTEVSYEGMHFCSNGPRRVLEGYAPYVFYTTRRILGYARAYPCYKLGPPLALRYAEAALHCMAELREMLEHEKANIETNIAHMDRVMTPMECHKPNMHEQDKMKIDKMRNEIASCWEDLSAQKEMGKQRLLILFQSCASLKTY
ncbi:hypothetical protein CTI12_AA518480 [Artemisia annua]|uniref:Uncharacterized protein n=1 Tax=Artemisia annua TaxID=35608 RepID=A0A2U1L8Q4_ARTAN|nr:hypothetical protein CTI12_AA518480 [Artemisia annua]